jgi:hypothetical protein
MEVLGSWAGLLRVAVVVQVAGALMLLNNLGGNGGVMEQVFHFWAYQFLMLVVGGGGQYA